MDVTFKKLLSQSVSLLVKAGVDSPCLDSEILLAHALDCSREKMVTELERKVAPKQLERFQSLLERRCRREPINYIIGSKEFWSIEFKVNPSVLIPRPETEFLMLRLLELNQDRFSPSRILDIGTGSGNLAIIPALEFPKSRVVSIDISSAALETARYTACLHQVEKRIRFLRGDIFDDVFCKKLQNFDFILSNPPYIKTGDLSSLMPEIRDFEPNCALNGGIDGLNFYRRIIPFARDKLTVGGFLIFEIGDDQWPFVSKLLGECFFKSGFLPDYSGKPRAIFAQKD